MDGVLVIDKPSGPTSHDVVARARIALELRRIGHTGTLDPLATGVLPLVVGRATRLAQFLSASSKTYEATIRLGLVTDTYDVLGRVVEEQPVTAAALDRSRVERALAAFRGPQMQMPPPFSAKKIGGVRAYDLARQARAVVLEAVPVTVDALELVAIEADSIRIRVTASAGFYVRSLAHALGAALGVGACLAALRRIKSGEFDLGHAVALEAVEHDPALALRKLVPLDALLPSMPAVRLTPDGCRRALNGATLGPEDVESGAGSEAAELFRLVDPAGHLRAVADRRGTTRALHPLVVLG